MTEAFILELQEILYGIAFSANIDNGSLDQVQFDKDKDKIHALLRFTEDETESDHRPA